MRPIDRILRRAADPAPTFAVRPFGTSASEAQATDAAADAATPSGSSTISNLTTGEPRVPSGSKQQSSL